MNQSILYLFFFCFSPLFNNDLNMHLLLGIWELAHRNPFRAREHEIYDTHNPLSILIYICLGKCETFTILLLTFLWQCYNCIIAFNNIFCGHLANVYDMHEKFVWLGKCMEIMVSFEVTLLWPAFISMALKLDTCIT